MNSSGALDTSFGGEISTDGTVFAILTQPDGKILVGGDFAIVNGVPRTGVVRLNQDGSLDPAFTLGTGFYGTIVSLALQSDGKVVIAGAFSGETNTFPASSVARILSNGEFDVALNSPERFSVSTFAVATQPDGKIVVGGLLFNSSSTTTGFLAGRNNSDGSIDATFSSPPINNSSVRSIIVQPDGKIVVGGTFSSFSGIARAGIAQLNPNGSLTSSFNLNNGAVYSLYQAGDGSIYAAGFTLKKYSPIGVDDSTLQVGTGFNGLIRSVDVQPDSRIMLGGLFSSYNGNSYPGLIRLLPNGAVDPTFSVGSGPSGPVYAVTTQPDGKIVVGGQFSSFSGVQKFSLVRLLEGSLPTDFDYDGDGRSDLSVRRPTDNVWYLLQGTAGYTAQQFGEAGDRITPADYDGDGKTDVAVFRPLTGTWFVFASQSQTFQQFGWGADGDLPVPTDRDNDGKADLVVFRPSNNTWYTRYANGTFATTEFGVAGDKPLVGDFDADGVGDIALFRPSNNNWYIIKSSLGFFIQTWGEAGDIPVPADFDGDGATDQGVFRPSTGQWFLSRTTDGFGSQNWGQAGDIPVAADYDGDGKADVAVFRPTNGTWYIVNSSTGQLIQQFGQAGDVPTQSAYLY